MGAYFFLTAFYLTRLYSPFHITLRYLEYWLGSQNGRGHGIHSPFLYELVTKVFRDFTQYEAYARVEALRAKLLKNTQRLSVLDLGAGSRATSSTTRSISFLTRHSAKPPKYAQLLFRLSRYYQPRSIMELGTSLGLSTAYLSLGSSGSRVFTLEGCPEIAAAASKNFQELSIDSIKLAVGSFAEQLPLVLPQIGPVDLAFLDGHHKKQPTLAYFEQLLPYRSPRSLFIIDDIHWSREMEEAWSVIRSHPEVALTIDLFSMGLVCFDPAFRVKQHFRIRY